MEWREWYKWGEANCGIEKGDKVTVFRRAKYKEMGWDNGWAISMNDTIGKIYEVEENPKYGTGIRLKDGSYNLSYPFFVLALVEKAKTKLDLPPDILDLIDQEDFGCAKEPVKKLVAKILKIKSSRG